MVPVLVVFSSTTQAAHPMIHDQGLRRVTNLLVTSTSRSYVVPGTGTGRNCTEVERGFVYATIIQHHLKGPAILNKYCSTPLWNREKVENTSIPRM